MNSKIQKVIVNYFLFGLKLISPIIVLPILSHRLSKEDLAVFLTLQAVAMIGSLFVQFGLHVSASRDIALAEDEAARRLISSEVLSCQVITVTAGIVFSVLAFLVSLNARASVEGGLIVSLLVLGLGLLPSWYLRGTDRSSLGILFEVLGQILSFLLVLLFLSSDGSAEMALLLTAIGPAALTIYANSMMIRELGGVRLLSFKRMIARLRASTYIFFHRLAATGTAPASVWLVSILSTPEQVNFYGIASRLIGILVLAPQPVLFVMLPTISKLYAGDRQVARRSSLKWSACVTGFSLFVCLVAFFFGDLVMRQLFSASTADSAVILEVMLVVVVLSAMRDSASDLFLIPMHQDRAVAVSMYIGVGFTLIVGIPAALYEGAMGMAAARILGEVMAFSMMMILLFKAIRHSHGK